MLVVEFVVVVSPLIGNVLVGASRACDEDTKWQAVVIDISYSIRRGVDVEGEEVRVEYAIAPEMFLQGDQALFWVHVKDVMDKIGGSVGVYDVVSLRAQFVDGGIENYLARW